MTYALPDFLFSTLRACIHFVPSQILAIDTFDADRKYPEGPTCPDSLVVVGTKRESVDSGEWHREATSSSIKPDLRACDNTVIIVAYKKTRA